MKALGTLATLICAGFVAHAQAATLACQAEASFDWYTHPDIRLGDDFDPEAGPPVYEVDLATGGYSVRFANRTEAHREGTMEVLQGVSEGEHRDFIGWDAANRHYMTIRVWVERTPFMVADRFGDAFGGHCADRD
jgi:hypothetical protein